MSKNDVTPTWRTHSCVPRSHSCERKLCLLLALITANLHAQPLVFQHVTVINPASSSIENDRVVVIPTAESQK